MNQKNDGVTPLSATNISLMEMSDDEMLIKMEMTKFIQTVNYWLLVVECLMVLCGVCGNLLALIVINRRSLRDTSSSVFITYLAIFDSSVLIVHITSLFGSSLIQNYLFHCILTFLTDFVTFTSVWIMVIMTLERCIAVHSPFLAKRFCTRHRARFAMYILIAIGFLIFSISFPFIYIVDRTQEKCGVRRQYQTFLRFVKPTIFYFIPDLILLINLFIIYELFMAQRRRTKTLINPENAVHQIDAASFNRKQQQLTIMLVAVSLGFYLFTTPAIVDYILQLNPPKHRDVKKLKWNFLRINLTVLWLQMSSATNFIFYCLAGSKFRAACLETIDDLSEYFCGKFNGDYRRRRSSAALRRNSSHTMELRNGISQKYHKRRRSTSVQGTSTYRMSNSSKRPSNDTILGLQTNNNRHSRPTLHHA